MSAHRSQCTMEVWLPPAVWYKNNSLHSLVGSTKANQILRSPRETVFWYFVYCKKNLQLFFFLFQRGHRFWRLPMWQSVHIRPLCMQFVFHLIGVWQSACPPGLLPVRRRQTHALSHTHTVIKQNRAVWRYVPRDRRCGTRLEANFDLVHSYNWCSAANVQNKEDNAANKTEPTGSCYTEKNSPTWRGRKWTITD